MIRLRILGEPYSKSLQPTSLIALALCATGFRQQKAREDQEAASAPIWTSRMDVSAGEINSGDRRRLMLLFDLALGTNLREFAVQFRSDQQGKACPIQPGH